MHCDPLVCEDSNINFQSDRPEDTWATFMSICLSLHIHYFAAPDFDNILYKVSDNMYYIVYKLIYVTV